MALPAILPSHGHNQSEGDGISLVIEKRCPHPFRKPGRHVSKFVPDVGKNPFVGLAAHRILQFDGMNGQSGL